MSDASPIDPDGWAIPEFRAIPWAEFRAELLALYEPPMRAKRTRDKMRMVLDLVGELIGPEGRTTDLTPALVARFIASRAEGSNTTTHGLLPNVRVACNYALSRGYLRMTPFSFRKAWIRKAPPAAQQHHSMESIRRVLDQLAGEVRVSEGWARWRARRLQALAALVAYTGLRRDEALFLFATDIDIPGRVVRLVERKGHRFKTESSAKPVPFPDELAPILLDWTAHRLDVPEAGHRKPGGSDWFFPNVTRSGPWTGGCIGTRPLDQLKAAGSRAGVEGFTFLSLRHSFATHGISWGLTPSEIQRVLRHTSAKTQEHYKHSDMPNLKAATKGIGFGPPSAEGGAG